MVRKIQAAFESLFVPAKLTQFNKEELLNHIHEFVATGL